MTSKEGGESKFTAVTCTLVALFSSSIRKQLSGVSASGQVLPKPSRPQRLKRFMLSSRLLLRSSLLLGASAGLAVMAAPSPALAITWNWSFQTDIQDQFGSGTFTTADPPPPVAGTIYTITSIAGTYSRGGTTYDITGLKSQTDNTFKWDGTSLSPILAMTAGISFFTDSAGSRYVNLYTIPSACPEVYCAIKRALTDFGGSNGRPTSSSLVPVQGPAPSGVPGPLPLFGAAAAFGWSRQLRRRINTPA